MEGGAEDDVEETVVEVGEVVVGLAERTADMYEVDASSILRALTPFAMSRESSVRRDLNLCRRWSKSEMEALEE